MIFPWGTGWLYPECWWSIRLWRCWTYWGRWFVIDADLLR
jgi:hypothetical protein